MKKFIIKVISVILLIALSIGFIPSTTSANFTGFTDIGHHPAGTRDAILWAQSRGIITGHSGRFFPDDSLTRGAFVLVMWRYAGQPNPGVSPGFRDVPQNHVAFNAISWAQNTGLVTGHNGVFYPESAVTREVVALVLHRYYKNNVSKAVPPFNAIDNFHDKNRVSPVAFEGICWAVTSGLITGSGGYIYPLDIASRAMVVLVLFRYENTFVGRVDTIYGNFTAAEIISNIRMGWSLGNTLDAHNDGTGFSFAGGSPLSNRSVSQLEQIWGRPLTATGHFTALKNAGFNAVRIPVTWYKACGPNLKIRDDWMARVKQVVDYAVAHDFYIVINTHHDDILFRLNDISIEESKRNLRIIWEQIAVVFRDYNVKLIFEGLNEPRTIGSAAEWSGGTPEEHRNLNILNQVFVDTIRATGGNNAHRILMVPTYAASANETAQRAFVLPRDSSSNKLVVSMHYYEPWNFALRTGDGSVTTWSASNRSDTDPITRAMDLAHNLFVSKGVPVIMGEMGAMNRDNLSARVAWAEYYTAYAKSKGIPCFWWDNGSYWVARQLSWGWEQTFGLLDRETFQIAHPEIVAALMRGTQ